MNKSYTYHLYCHLVWATWDRLPLITSEIESSVYAAIATKCRELGAEPIAMGGISDHVHLLVRFPGTLALADLAREVKDVSSHLVTRQLKPGQFFKWQGGYGAFTVSRDSVDKVVEYIHNQKTHHAHGSLQVGLEAAAE